MRKKIVGKFLCQRGKKILIIIVIMMEEGSVTQGTNILMSQHFASLFISYPYPRPLPKFPGQFSNKLKSQDKVKIETIFLDHSFDHSNQYPSHTAMLRPLVFILLCVGFVLCHE
jgi:hypothetical protein